MEGFLGIKQNCLFLVVLFTIFVNARGFGFGQKFCEDVTVNDCNIDERNPKVIRATPNINQEHCQAICDAETDCAVFRYEKKTGKCSRFDKDYRQECISGGGPADHSIATCLGTALNSCDEFLEEDCTYDMLKDDSTIPSRPVAEPQHCQEECQNLAPICGYWVYQNKTCYLLKSGKRNCSVISGPKFPKIATCPFANNNETSSAAPSTTTTSKIDETSTIIPTKFQTTIKTTSKAKPTTKQQEETSTTTQAPSTTRSPPTTNNDNIASSTIQLLTTTLQSKTPKTTTVTQPTTEVESTTTDANAEISSTQPLTSTTESSDITETQDGSTMTPTSNSLF